MQQPQTPLLDSLLAALAGDLDADDARSFLAALAASHPPATDAAPPAGPLQRAVARLDEVLSKQLSAVIHHPAFQTLEGSWRGLAHLVYRTETDETLAVKLLQASKQELAADFRQAETPDASFLHRVWCSEPLEGPGGEPFGALTADFEFDRSPEDLELLAACAQIGAAAHSPLLAAAAPGLFGWTDFNELAKVDDLAAIFQPPEYDAWRAFRESQAAAFVVLTCPRVLARPVYGVETNPLYEFRFEEVDAARAGLGAPREAYVWMNCAYALAAVVTRAFDETGWCTAVRGAENGGKVSGLPRRLVESEDGAGFAASPTEVQVGARRVAELARLGVLALRHYKNDDHATFFGGQTCRKPPQRDTPEAAADAALETRLPFVFAAGRIAQYVKAIARDVFRGRVEKQECEAWLKRWLARCVWDGRDGAEGKARCPLAEAEVQVLDSHDDVRDYRVVLHLRPWLAPDELAAPARIEVQIPRGVRPAPDAAPPR